MRASVVRNDPHCTGTGWGADRISVERVQGMGLLLSSVYSRWLIVLSLSALWKCLQGNEYASLIVYRHFVRDRERSAVRMWIRRSEMCYGSARLVKMRE